MLKRCIWDYFHQQDDVRNYFVDDIIEDKKWTPNEDKTDFEKNTPTNENNFFQKFVKLFLPIVSDQK